MKLIELIKYLLNPEQLDELYQEKELNRDSEALEVFMKEPLNLESEIVIFEIEETEGYRVLEKEGIRYVNLFTIDHAKDLIEFDLDLKNKGYSNLEIAKRLLEYVEYDA